MKALSLLAALFLAGCAAQAHTLEPAGSGWGMRRMCFNLCIGVNGEIRT